MSTRVLTYFYKTGQDKDGNSQFTFEARERGKNATMVRDGLYKDDAQHMETQVARNPEKFGF